MIMATKLMVTSNVIVMKTKYTRTLRNDNHQIVKSMKNSGHYMEQCFSDRFPQEIIWGFRDK